MRGPFSFSNFFRFFWVFHEFLDTFKKKTTVSFFNPNSVSTTSLFNAHYYYPLSSQYSRFGVCFVKQVWKQSALKYLSWAWLCSFRAFIKSFLLLFSFLKILSRKKLSLRSHLLVFYRTFWACRVFMAIFLKNSLTVKIITVAASNSILINFPRFSKKIPQLNFPWK